MNTRPCRMKPSRVHLSNRGEAYCKCVRGLYMPLTLTTYANEVTCKRCLSYWLKRICKVDLSANVSQ